MLTDAVGELEAHGADRAEQWYHLAAACHQAERYEDVVQAARTAVRWLYNLREKGRLDDADMPDNCRMLLTTAHRSLGEDEAALEYLTEAIDDAHSSGHRSMLPFALTEAGELLTEYGRHAEAAARFGEASQAHQAIGDPHTAAHSRRAEAMAWFRDGETERALAAFGAADRAYGRCRPGRRSRTRSPGVTWTASAP